MAQPVGDVPIRGESIRLGQFLNLANLIDSGSDAKGVIADGLVLVNVQSKPAAVGNCAMATPSRSAADRPEPAGSPRRGRDHLASREHATERCGRPGAAHRRTGVRHRPRLRDGSRSVRRVRPRAGAQLDVGGSDQHGRRVRPQPDGDRLRGVGTGPLLRRPIPARYRHAGAGQHRRTVLHAVDGSRGAAA